MNSEHLRTFVWLRWRLFIHQLQRGGIANTVILIILTVLLILGVLFFSVGSFLAGLFFVHDVPAHIVPAVVMFVWDGAVIFFFFSWFSGLIAELQRSEALALDKFLHLPVSLGGVFVLNYVSSLLCLTMVLFLPAALGFGLAVCFSIGPTMLVVLPLLASFLLMVTGLSYQFQGWLASLMVNKRRRRSIVVLVTFIFVMLFQLPNLFNIIRPWEGAKQAVEKRDKTDEEHDEQVFQEVTRIAGIVNLVLPPGWLPLGAKAAAEGSVWPALLGTLGMGLIGAASLRRAYKTTIRLYTGSFTGTRPARGLPPAAKMIRGLPHSAKRQAENMLEKRLPGLSEQAAVTALAGLRSLLRAPEVKMLLLTPVLLVVIFGAMLFRPGFNVPVEFRPLLGFGAIAMSLLSLIGVVGNQFAYDRSGFRAFVLSPASRRDILLGKNLAVAPLAAVLCLGPLALVQIILPSGIEQALAEPLRFVTMYLLLCMLANWLSLLAPLPIAAGTLKPKNVKLVPLLLQMLCVLLLPLVLAPALLPLLVQYGLRNEAWAQMAPVNLLSALILCAVVVLVYWLVLMWQGKVLQSLELNILQIITTKAE